MTLIDTQGNLFQLCLSENRCRLIFWSAVESPSDRLTKDDIVDDFEWPLKVIRVLQTVYMYFKNTAKCSKSITDVVCEQL